VYRATHRVVEVNSFEVERKGQLGTTNLYSDVSHLEDDDYEDKDTTGIRGCYN
jgi:hypothetical protein